MTETKEVIDIAKEEQNKEIATESETNATPSPEVNTSSSASKPASFKFNALSAILIGVVVILIVVVVILIIKRPKVNTELLAQREEMYNKSQRELKDSKLEHESTKKKMKVYESNNAQLMENNAKLSTKLSEAERIINDYRNRESQALELTAASNEPKKSFASRKQEKFNLSNKYGSASEKNDAIKASEEVNTSTQAKEEQHYDDAEVMEVLN